MDTALAVALVSVAGLAWDFGRRYVGARQTYFADRKQVERLEDQVVEFTANIDKALTDHKATHEAAIKNLVEEMRGEFDSIRTKVGIAAAAHEQRAQGKGPRRLTRLR